MLSRSLQSLCIFKCTAKIQKIFETTKFSPPLACKKLLRKRGKLHLFSSRFIGSASPLLPLFLPFLPFYLFTFSGSPASSSLHLLSSNREMVQSSNIRLLSLMMMVFRSDLSERFVHLACPLLPHFYYPFTLLPFYFGNNIAVDPFG